MYPHPVHSSIWRKRQFFNRTKQSFAIIKYSNLYLNSPKEPLFQKNPLPEEIQWLKEILRTIKKHRLKINPQAAAKSSPEQQSSANLKLASCPIPPPGQVRLPPEGESPPVPHSRPDWSKMKRNLKLDVDVILVFIYTYLMNLNTLIDAL